MSTIQSANYSEFKQYASFSSIDEMNLAIRQFLYSHSHELTPATIQVYKTISRFACKIIGVCWTKVSSLAIEIGISERTVRRAFAILEQFGALKRIPTQRKQGGDGHNLYVIQPYVSANVSGDLSGRKNEQTLDKSDIKPTKSNGETGSFKTEHSNREEVLSNNVQGADKLDATYTPSFVPEPFISVSRRFFNSASIIYQLWRKVRLAYAKSGLVKPIEYLQETIIQAFKESIFALKTNKIKGDFNGYFYGVLTNLLSIEKRRETPMYNWLET